MSSKTTTSYSEEAAYRAKVRRSMNAGPKSVKRTGNTWLRVLLGGLAVFFIFCLVIVIFAFNAINPAKQIEEAEKKAAALAETQRPVEKFTSFDGASYSYTVIYSQENDNYTAKFDPAIPRDDRNFIEAAFEVFKKSFGDTALINPQPLIENRNGMNFVKFDAGNGQYYYVWPTKDENTGVIYSLIYWKE